MRQRTIVCPLIQNDGAYLLCKMADDRGVFPGQWALSGGGVEPGERIEEALRREIREELGEQLLLTEITPWTFSDDIRTKTYADGRKGNDSNLLIVFYVQIMPDDFVMQLHR
ncbi:nucleoside triphosphatase NudI, partial [Escherichia coli]